MNKQWLRIGNRKGGSKSLSDKNATQNKPQEPAGLKRNELVLLGNFAERFCSEDVWRTNTAILRKWSSIRKIRRLDMGDGTLVIVQMIEGVVLSAEDFRDTVEAVAAEDHENLLPLRGYFYGKDKKFLLYDYMPTGSLSDLLYGYRGCLGTPLTWEVRLSIALGVARAIEHLHAQYIYHGNIKSSSVFLTSSYEARVSEFGIALLTPASMIGDEPTMKDVYDFGALLLELLTRPPTQALLKEEGRRAWVQSIVRMGWSAEFFAVELLRYNNLEELFALLQVAISCVSPNWDKRPGMSIVRRKIEKLCGPGRRGDGDSQQDKDSKGAKDTSCWPISGAQVDRDSQLSQIREVNTMYTRKPPDGVLEVFERVYVFGCCFTVDGLKNWDHQMLVRRVVCEMRQHFPDAFFEVFNFGEQKSQSQMSEVSFHMPVMNYPIHNGDCPILTMEMIHLFLRSADAWLSCEEQRCMLLMHCERGGWPVLAFMLAALLLYRKKSNGEEETLHLIYKKASPDLLHLISPLNPLPSQLRYLHYISTLNVDLEGSLPYKALTLDSVILRSIPCLDAEVGCHLMFKIFGQDPHNLTDKTPTVLFPTPERGKDIRHCKQADCKLVKVDIHCPVQGDVVLECVSLDGSLERGETMFRVMFNTAYLLENVLMLGLDQMDVPWDCQNHYSKEFRAEITFSEMNPAASLVSVDSSSDEEEKENRLAKGAKKIEAQELQVEDQAVYSALPSQDTNTSHEDNEVQEWPIHSDIALPTSILRSMLSSPLESSVHVALDGSLACSDSASSSLSQDRSPVNFNAMLTKKNIELLESPEQQLVSSLELSQDVHFVSVGSPGDDEQTETQIAKRDKKLDAQELQVEDQAVYSALPSQDANTSHEENEVRDRPDQSNTISTTSILVPTLPSQLGASVHSGLGGPLASSDSASSSPCQDGSLVSFRAMLTKNDIEPLQSPKQQLVSSVELSQEIHSGESIQFHWWKEGITAATANNFEMTSHRKCASSSTVTSDSVEATKEPFHDSAQILKMTMPQEEKYCQLDCVTSSTSMSSGFDYDVFLSFRGPDTRSGITDFLYTSLLAAGIHTYRDDDELRIGEEIGPELLKAINHSKISIPILSKGYAFSKWCLKELVQMVECRKARRQKIMPIFYDVTPFEVRHQTGSYGDAFVLHEKQFDNKVISKWKAALKVVGDLKGWDIDSMITRQEGELVKHIVQKVITELKKAYLLVTDCLVGIEHHVKEINRLVCSDSEDIQILGIHGMGGVGKTTLAKIIYNHLSHHFEDCCFISNVRETSQLKGIECLQNQLLSDILKRNWSNISNVDDGIKTIKERLCDKKVLVLLDDVDKKIHLNALMGRPVWFGLGSRIIITSRNIDVFNVPEVCFTYELMGMDFSQSLQLFCKHAFGRDYPLDEYADFSNEVVKMTGGLPLALEVIGSLLWGKSKDVWDVTLKKLEKVPHNEVKRKLKICYDALDDRQKQIFLDIACLFIGFDRRIVLHMWNDSNLFPGEGLQVLQQMSLIKIGEDNKLWMHDQLRDLGRDIVRQECNMEPEKQTRLWNHEEASDIVMRKKGTKKVEALCLKFDHQLQQSFTNEELGSLSNLRYLEMSPVLDNRPLSGFPKNVLPLNPPILSELRWLSWHNFPPALTLTTFSMMNMVILDLSWSKFSENWDGWNHIKMARNLKVLNLTGCAQLHSTPNFFAYVKLEQLILEGCGRLVQIDESIGQLKQLVLLNLRSCRKLRNLPEELANLESLKELLLDYTSIREIPGSRGMRKLETLSACECLSLNNCNSIGNLTSLLSLSLEHVEISQLPLEIGRLIRVEHLSLSGCKLLKRIPESIGNLELVVVLNLSHTCIAELPNSLGNLKNLKILRMCGSSFRSIPSAIGMLEKLEEIDAEFCRLLEGTIPDDIGRLLSLRILKVSNTRICYVPRLPESLLSLHIGTNSMKTFPDLLNLINLTELNLEIAQDFEFCLAEEKSIFVDTTKLIQDPSPWWIGNLCNLESLKLSCDNITVLHADIGLLSELKRLELLCFNLQFLPRLPSSLLCLHIKSSRSMETLIDLSNLKELSELRIYSSAITDIGGLKDLENLQTLDLRALNTLEKLPDLSNLKKLSELHLGHCHNLINLQSIQGLGNLRILKLIEILQIERLPDLSNLKKLTELHLQQCHSLTEIQSFEGLENLIMLKLSELPLLERLPDLSNLIKLRKLDLQQCQTLVKIQGTLDSLEDLCIYGCSLLVEVPGPSSFKNLKSLQLRDCEMLQMDHVWALKSDTFDTVCGSSKCSMMRRLGICVCQLGRHFFLPSLPP